MEDNTPDKFYRGISSADAISAEGYITEAAFSFDKFDRNPRSDDYCELSINWNDDDGALLTLLSQRKPFKDEPQFKIGYCSIQKSMMRNLFRQYIVNENFTYERRPIQKDEINDIVENPYHGNLLLKKDVSKALKKNIQCGLATLATCSLKKREK